MSQWADTLQITSLSQLRVGRELLEIPVGGSLEWQRGGPEALALQANIPSVSSPGL